jgi:hypothetical protein
MKGRRFTAFELSLINELAIIASLLVDRLSEPRDLEGRPEFSTLSSLVVREVVDIAVRTAAARKRLAHFRRLRGRRDGRPGADELARLKLGGLDLDAPFGCDDLQS